MTTPQPTSDNETSSASAEENKQDSNKPVDSTQVNYLRVADHRPVFSFGSMAPPASNSFFNPLSNTFNSTTPPNTFNSTTPPNTFNSTITDTTNSFGCVWASPLTGRSFNTPQTAPAPVDPFAGTYCENTSYGSLIRVTLPTDDKLKEYLSCTSCEARNPPENAVKLCKKLYATVESLKSEHKNLKKEVNALKFKNSKLKDKLKKVNDYVKILLVDNEKDD